MGHNRRVRHLALRHMTSFACLGDACEDTCCQRWRITVDEEHYHALGAAMHEERARFEEAVRPTGSEDRRHFALVVLGDDGRCRLLDDQQLCSVHRRYGEAVLPNACSMYPRALSDVGGRLELGGELSCPEVARRALTADDAVDLVESGPEPAGRGVVRQRLAPSPNDPYLARFDDLRAAMYQLLSANRYPIRSRLLFTAYLANRLGEYFHRGTTRYDGARFDADLELVLRPEVQRQLHEQLGAAPDTESMAPMVLVVILSARLESPAPPVFERLVAQVVGRHLGEPPSSPAAALQKLGPAALWTRHRARRAALEKNVGPRLERALSNYARNFWMLDWYLGAPTLMQHVQGLLVRIAALRMLVYGHPVLDEASGEARIDGAIVEAAYSFSRTLEHNRALLDDIARSLEQSGMLTLAHSVSLLAF